jgi:hypothetical protein
MVDSPQRDLLRLAATAVESAERRGRPLEMCAALTALARAYQALKAHGAAEEMLRQAHRWAYGSGSIDLQVDVLCELGEAACAVAQDCLDADPGAARAALDRARDIAFEIAQAVRHVSDPQWEAKSLLRASDVLNRCGDHEDAAWLQGRALQLMLGAKSGRP